MAIPIPFKTLGNLSAIHAARTNYQLISKAKSKKLSILCSSEAHSSLYAIAKVMDFKIHEVKSNLNGQIDIKEAKKIINKNKNIFCIVANAGATNSGAIDNINVLASLAKSKKYGYMLMVHMVWLHLQILNQLNYLKVLKKQIASSLILINGCLHPMIAVHYYIKMPEKDQLLMVKEVII